MAIEHSFSSRRHGIHLSMSDEERRDRRLEYDAKKLAKITYADSKSRLEYFFDETCAQEEAWIAQSPDGFFEGWFDSKCNRDLVPLWAHERSANFFLEAKGTGWSVIPIPLDDLLDEVLPSVHAVQYDLAIFPSEEHNHIITTCQEAVALWGNYWKRFAKSLI